MWLLLKAMLAPVTEWGIIKNNNKKNRAACFENEFLLLLLWVDACLWLRWRHSCICFDFKSGTPVPSGRWPSLGQVFYQSFPASHLPADVMLLTLVVPGWTGSPASPCPGSCSTASWRDSAGGGFLLAQEMQLLISAKRTPSSTHPF